MKNAQTKLIENLILFNNNNSKNEKKENSTKIARFRKRIMNEFCFILCIGGICEEVSFVFVI